MSKLTSDQDIIPVQSQITLTKPSRNSVIESYKMTFANAELGIYGERLMLRIIEAAQFEIDKLSFADKKDIRRIDVQKETSLFGDVTLTMDLRTITGNTHNISEEIKKSIESLVRTSITFYETDGRRTIPFIKEIFIPNHSYRLSVTVEQDVWDLLMNFSEGYRKYSLRKALSLRSVFALKIYQMLSGQTKELVYKIPKFREQFCVTAKKYPDTTDLVRYVIKPAMKELEKSQTPYTFDFKPVYTECLGRKPELTAFKFLPVYRPEFDENNEFRPDNLPSNVSEQTAERSLFNERQEQILFTSFGLTHEGIMRNLKLFKEAASTINFRDFFKKTLEAKSPDIKNPAGFFINELKKALKEAKEKKPNN